MNDDVESPGFGELGLRAELLGALTALGYEEATPIQAQAIPALVEGKDVVGQAATGTGKTAAFALPILQRLAPRAERGREPSALVLVPTRELAVQVSEAIYKYGRELGVRVVPVFGGQPIQRQLKSLGDGADVVVATPGRAIDHLERGTLQLDRIATVVLDEADEMLDMGFAEDIETILATTPGERQTVLFSATMPPRIAGIAKRHLTDPVRITVGRQALDDDGVRLVRETAYIVMRAHKPAALGRILDVESPTAAIVFCRTRTEVDELTETMNGRGYRAEALHGGMGQEIRDKVMARLRAGTTELLLATDVAARGLDISQLSHVVNYDVPSAPEAYVHRIGRVGRAGRQGVAITLAEPREQRLLGNIERLTKHTITIERVPTVADLRARQYELTETAVRDAAADADGLDEFAPIVDSLAADFDLRTLALVGVKLAHIASGATEDAQEIPEARAKAAKPARGDAGSGTGEARGERAPRPTREVSGDVALLYISLGKAHGVRPGDLVGAIANETDLVGSQIGPIRVQMYFSTVGVPASEAAGVIEAMQASSLRGKKVTVRPFTDEPRDDRPRRSRDESGWEERSDSDRPSRSSWTPRSNDDRSSERRPRERFAADDGAPSGDDGSQQAPRERSAGDDGAPFDRRPRPDRDAGDRPRQPWKPSIERGEFRSRDDGGRPPRDGWVPRDNREPRGDRGGDRRGAPFAGPRGERSGSRFDGSGRGGNDRRPEGRDGTRDRGNAGGRDWSPAPRSGRSGSWGAGRSDAPGGRPGPDNWVPREMRPAPKGKPAGKGGYPRSGAPRPGGNGAPRGGRPGAPKGPRRNGW